MIIVLFEVVVKKERILDYLALAAGLKEDLARVGLRAIGKICKHLQ